MANHKSALKRARQEKSRNAHNKSRRSTGRTLIKEFQKLLSDKTPEAQEKIKTLFVKIQSLLGKLVKTKIMKPNQAARKISRLAKKRNLFLKES